MGLLSTIISKAVPVLSKLGGAFVTTGSEFKSSALSAGVALKKISTAVSPYLKTTKGKIALGVTGGAIYSPTIRQSIYETVKKEPLAPLILTPLAPLVYGKQTGKAYEIAKDPNLTTREKISTIAKSAIGPVAIGLAGGLLAAPVVTGAVSGFIDNKVMPKSPSELPIPVSQNTPLSQLPIVGNIPTSDSKIYKEVQPSIKITNRPNILVNTRINTKFNNKNGNTHRHSRTAHRC
jgi:hypothetical protein